MDEHVRMPVRLRDALGLIGHFAEAELSLAGHQAASALVKLGLKVSPDVEVDLFVPNIAILCYIADKFRAMGEKELLAELESIIQLLKGHQPRIISGTINLVARTPAELDDHLEALRQRMIIERERVGNL